VTEAYRVQVCAGAESDPAAAPCAEVRLDVLGRPLHVQLRASARPVRLPDLVPAAIAISSAVTDAATGQLASLGERPHCRKGCAACCRFLVPVSAVEALWMWEQMAAVPCGERSRLLEAYVAGARRVLKAGPPLVSGGLPQRIEAAARWYAELGLDCPFLVGEACAAYARRPLACREFLAHCRGGPTSGRGRRPPPETAAGPFAIGEAVRLPISPASALAELAGEFEPLWPKAIVLPLALAWAADAAGRPSPQRWSASILARRLAEVLQGQADRHEREAQAA
jgi:Fe-S-cluster containining protein